MSPERLTPERRRQLTQEALIEAAVQVFTKKGFNGASLDEIAETAGFSRGAIYSNFGSKEELLSAVLDHYNDLRLAGMAEAIEADATNDPQDAALAAAKSWRQLFFRHSELLMLDLELKLYAMRNPEARRRLAALERDRSEKLAGFVQEGLAGVPLSVDDARDIADIGRAAVDGLEQLAAIDEEQADNYKRLVSVLFIHLARAGAAAAAISGSSRDDPSGPTPS